MGKEIAAATREQASGSENVTQSIGRLQELVSQINGATTQQAQGSEHIMKAVESMREVTKYVRQAMVEQRSGSTMISSAAERMIDMIHEIFQVATSQASESEKIVRTMEQVRAIAVAGKRRRKDLVAMPFEDVGDAPPAPAAVICAVHEHECRARSRLGMRRCRPQRRQSDRCSAERRAARQRVVHHCFLRPCSSRAS